MQNATEEAMSTTNDFFNQRMVFSKIGMEYIDAEFAEDKQRLFDAGFAIMREYAPNYMDRGEWATAMIEDYPKEVTEVFGEEPNHCLAMLSDMWDCDNYLDPNTGIEMQFSEWAEYFSFLGAENVYNELVETKAELNKIKEKLKEIRKISEE